MTSVFAAKPTAPMPEAKKKDHYENFAALAKVERKGKDYQMTVIDRKDPISVIAIHGGLIELGSSHFARRLAGSDKNLYLFEGVKTKHNQLLHLTSTRFDEPQALALVKKSSDCISIHGYKDSDASLCIGGLNTDLAKRMVKNLKDAKLKYEIIYPCEIFPGKEPDNIANLSQNKGVQLELSSKLRDLFQQHPEIETQTVAAIRTSFLSAPTTTVSSTTSSASSATAVSTGTVTGTSLSR